MTTELELDTRELKSLYKLLYDHFNIHAVCMKDGDLYALSIWANRILELRQRTEK